MKTFAGALLGAGLVTLGIWIGKGIPEGKPKIQLYCADIKLTELATGILQADPCLNKATVIYGGKSLCDDHLDVFLSEMTGSLED